MKKLIPFLLIGALLSGCNRVTEPIPTEIPTPPVVTASASEDIPTRQIAASDSMPIFEGWSKLGDYETDITNDGKADRIMLATSAASDKNGEILWDDSQEWAIAVVTPDEVYTLFDKRMSGNVYIDIGTHDDVGYICAYVASNSGTTVYEYTYADGEFTEKTFYDITDKNVNKMYSTLPDYTEAID